MTRSRDIAITLARASRFAIGFGLAAAALAAFAASMIAAPEPPRAISFFNIHTKETLTVVYKRDGKYVPEAMTQINWILRDWRRNEPTTMDPGLIDLAWEVHDELGGKEPIHVISGYRSPATNAMLRKTVGGQAKKSQHMLGKAMDVHFPGVPLRQLRYSGLIRERGGVGYYPTSAIPFVHLDVDRVRHWPAMPRHELALLFPDGRSKHVRGGRITPGEVKAARERHAALATEVTAFLDLRNGPKWDTRIVSAPVPAPRPVAAKPPKKEAVVAALAPDAAPKLAREPRLAERPSRLILGPSRAERQALDQLVMRETETPPRPRLAERAAVPLPAPAGQARATPDQIAALIDAENSAAGGSWAVAPAFDEEHPDELFYRPFPLAPFLTSSPSADDPALVASKAPDLGLVVETIGDGGSAAPLRFRPGQQVAQVLWAQQFQGKSVGYGTLAGAGEEVPAPAGLAQRSVTTSTR